MKMRPLWSRWGANAVRPLIIRKRLTFYDLMDKYGIVTWAEIPQIGPGGYQDQGYINQPSFRGERERAVERIDSPAL